MNELIQRFDISIEPKIKQFYSNLNQINTSEDIINILSELNIIKPDMNTAILNDREIQVSSIPDINKFVRNIENSLYRVYFTIRAISQSSVSISLD